MPFCSRNNCDNILTSVVTNTGLIYRCLVCFEEYELTDEDTLMIDEYIQESDTTHKHQNYLQNAYADSIIELERKKCPNSGCNETIVHVVKIAQNGQSLYICPTCKYQFN